jgi:hypothetical protein
LQIETVPESLYLYRLGPHGFGQRSASHNSYLRPLTPFLSALPTELGLALLYAAGAYRATLVNRAEDGTNASVSRSSRGVRDRVHGWITAVARPSKAGAGQGDQLWLSFERATKVAVFEAGEPSRFDPLREVRVSSTNGTIRIESSGDEPQLALRIPGSAFVTRGPLLIRLDMTSPKATAVEVFWKTPTMPLYCREHSVRTYVDAGRNVRFLRIPAPVIVGRVRFDPAACPGTTRLHSLEIRREASAGRDHRDGPG